MSMVPRAALAAALLIAGAARAAPPQLELDVHLDPATRALRVEATLRADRIPAIALHESLNVTAAALDGKPVVAQAGAVVQGVREWRLASTVRAGQALHIVYEGALAPLDRRADHRRVLRRLPPMAAPEGSFLSAGSAWYPWPGALFTYRVRLSLPAGQRGLVAGDLVQETLAAGEGAKSVATFEMRAPTDGIDLMAGPYTVAERVLERAAAPPLRLRTYFTPAIASLAADYLDDSARYIARYAKQIGAYPFASFSVVASPLPTGFGMPTLTYIGEAVLRLPFIRATSLGHEVLHNWWGNGVYVDVAKGNWAEGLTTFMADYAFKEDASAEAAREMRLGWLRDFAALPPGAAKPLSAFRSRAHGADAATGYGKAAMLFVMLRDLIGAAAFEQGLRGFWQAQRFRAASWSDLRSAFESTSGRDLSSFFAQWLGRADAPAPRVVSARAHGAEVELTLAQSSPPYALRIPLEFDTPEGAVARTVEIAGARQTVTVSVPGSATAVRLDPDLRLWRALDPQTLPPILRQWILARAPRFAVVSDTVDVRVAARRIATRLFESPAREVALRDDGKSPLLIVGVHADVDAALARLHLPSRPSELEGRGTAQVWAVLRKPDATPIAVISARDGAAIEALARPLPHYGAQSFLAFDGPRAILRGVWPIQARRVAVKR